MPASSVILAFPSLAAYWKCDETSGNLADSSGNSKTLTYSGSGAIYSGSDITLDGATGYFSRTDSILGSTLPSEWTMGLFVNGLAQDAKFVFGMGRSSSNTPACAIGSGVVASGQSSSSGKCFVRTDANTSLWGNASGEAYGTAFDDTWHLIVALRRSGVYRYFIDGTEVGNVTIAQGTTTLDRTALGCFLRATAASFFAGRVSHAFACTAAISNTDITDLFANLPVDPPRVTIETNDANLFASPYNWKLA